MGRLQSRDTLTLRDLYIPGTHQSAMTPQSVDVQNSKFAIKPETLTAVANRLMPRTMRGWVVCQDLSITQQLELGVRYLDLRISYHAGEDTFYLTHRYSGPSLASVLDDIVSFYRTNSTRDSELLLLSITSDYDNKNTLVGHEEAYMSLIRNHPISQKLVKPEQDVMDLHIDQFGTTPVAILTGGDSFTSQPHTYSTAQSYDNTWHNKNTHKEALHAARRSLNDQSQNARQLKVVQAIVTPSVEAVGESIGRVVAMGVALIIMTLTFAVLAATHGVTHWKKAINKVPVRSHVLIAAIPLTLAAILITLTAISYFQRPQMSVRSVSKQLALDAASEMKSVVADTPGKVLLVDFATRDFCNQVVLCNAF